MSEYSGQDRRVAADDVPRRLAASTPVTACGYMNSASAEPRASVA